MFKQHLIKTLALMKSTEEQNMCKLNAAILMAVANFGYEHNFKKGLTLDDVSEGVRALNYEYKPTIPEDPEEFTAMISANILTLTLMDLVEFVAPLPGVRFLIGSEKGTDVGTAMLHEFKPLKESKAYAAHRLNELDQNSFAN